MQRRKSKNIPRIRCTRVNDLDDDVGMQEVAGDHVRAKGCRFLLKYDRNDIVADVSLALQLLWIPCAVWKQRRHMEQHLTAAKHLVHCRVSRLAVSCIQTAAIPEEETIESESETRIRRNEKTFRDMCN